MSRNIFNFYYSFRVRYSEVDAQGIVFNAHYLTYFDTAMTEYLRHIKYDYVTSKIRAFLDSYLWTNKKQLISLSEAFFVYNYYLQLKKYYYN